MRQSKESGTTTGSGVVLVGAIVDVLTGFEVESNFVDFVGFMVEVDFVDFTVEAKVVDFTVEVEIVDFTVEVEVEGFKVVVV